MHPDTWQYLLLSRMEEKGGEGTRGQEETGGKGNAMALSLSHVLTELCACVCACVCACMCVM